MSEDLTGRRLGHYRIDGVIGQGGMSVMYRATDVRLGRKVALKVIADHLTVDAEFRERFVDEARNTSAIDHSHVVPLYDFGEVDGLLYIAMRFVDGSDLASLIKDGPISPERTLRLIGQVADALDMLHGRGLVHLDIKPANMLVTNQESASEHVYLADFGLTRRGATGHRTRGGDFLGSPTYAAPEHLRGEPVDPRTDAYSLACVLFACLTGRPPFQGKVPEVIQGHLGKEAPAISSLVQLPPTIDEVIRRGMAKEPAKRYANCRELVAAATKALASVPQPSAPPAYRPPPQKAPAPAPQQQQQPQPAPQGLVSRPPMPPHQTYPQQSHQQPPRPAPQPGYQQPPPNSGEPMRLRPPMPAGTTAFAKGSNSGLARWVIPVLAVVAVAVVVLVVVLVVNGAGKTPENPIPPTSPSVSKGLPTNVPTVTR
ncbi:serine/threonine protein kinase [Allokutzneria sp. A3M-2-11 16]|uniref:serine/threonine-protein kinase n=1 Tax=Allokutzneria sp. A3M-2-11 16 TaxID=2962043 RepID=UPI0020B74DB9|nr:serine/threonine-protein kinase [Allokutzneria sp. A3M-2-11 16]MCP3800062.1 serine/threonine protein kinase [Allokutzneria sp. A3M-2-11 16]